MMHLHENHEQTKLQARKDSGEMCRIAAPTGGVVFSAFAVYDFCESRVVIVLGLATSSKVFSLFYIYILPYT